MSSTPIDIAIFGGGIAGLWLINILRKAGYSCVLLETGTLGGQQTLLSQGIIHGGLKYALGGSLSSESEAIAGMPDRWRACINGDGELDLRDVRVLSDTQHLWSAGSLASRFTTFFASRMLRGRIAKLKPAEYPSALNDPQFRGSVYRLDDLVIDTPTLIEALATPHAEALLQYDPLQTRIEWDNNGIRGIHLDGVTLQPRLTLLAAGAGNEKLLAGRQGDKPAALATQRRPLHMAMVRHRLPHRLYAHCIGASNKPRLTVTTHDLPDGSLIWYLGGDLAERGVEMSEAALAGATRDELNLLFPWLNFSDAQISSVRIDRAEPREQGLVKPDNARAERDADTLVAWPTKLTLVPDLGERVLRLLEGDAPMHAQPALPPGLARAKPGKPIWENLAEQDQ